MPDGGSDAAAQVAIYRDVLARMAEGKPEAMLRPSASAWALAEIDRLRAAIEAHRDRWQSVNGTRPEASLPSDLELWEALDA